MLLTGGGTRTAIVALSAALVAACLVAGGALWRLRAYRRAAAQNAARQRDEQREREQRAVLMERVRIARELHDVVAHHMSVIAVQAGLARYVLTSDPPTAERALRAVAEMSSDGLAEVRRLVTVLRPERDSDESRDRDTPGVDELPAMIERVGLTGVAIEFSVSGRTRSLPAGVGLCVYRVVQESLTNAIKHARGARVDVLLSYEDDRVRVRIANDGRGGPHPRSSTMAGPDGQAGGGKGLTGMYERAILYGGTLSAGGLADGGFEVILTLPLPVVDEPPVDERAPTELGARP
ncbi:hypothetical protein GCM10023322_44560 [Rugosimonospora acidiphila]|uniref:histidine kinase n=1 Tax=Rugosimonospora acidiphila TaxID=556531 RepID=A0ABP9S182_9ACTN